MPIIPDPFTTVDDAAMAKRLGTSDTAEAAAMLEVAVALLTDYTAGAWKPIPPKLLDEAVLRVGRALWDGRKVPGNGAQYATAAGEAAPPPPADPLRPAYPMLQRYVGGFA